MPGFNWYEENSTDEFRDIPDEVNGNQPEPSQVVGASRQSRPAPQQAPAPQPVQEEYAEPVLEESEEDFEAVLADANLRIELATLYKMIMNHDLFEGTDADPRAIDTVTRGIRKFAREQMEIMLGMRRDATKEAIVSSPFNDLEVVVLKKLASTYSKGATETAEAARPQPAAKAISRREGLNTIGGGAKPASRPNPVAPKAALTAKPKAPLQRQAKEAAPVISEEDYTPLTKPVHEMTEQERLERNKEASARQANKKPAKSSTAMAQPTPDQEEMFHTQRVMTSDHPLANTNAVSAILSALNKSKQ